MSVLQAASGLSSQVPLGGGPLHSASLTTSGAASALSKTGHGDAEPGDSYASHYQPQPELSSGFLCGIPLMIGAVGTVMAFSTALCLKAFACCCLGLGVLGGGAFGLSQLLKR